MWDDLEGDLNADSVKVAKPKKKHPCTHCGGSGFWSGGTNRYGQKKCFACKGKGYFLTSATARAKARTSSAARKKRIRDEAIAAITGAHPDLIAGLMQIASWHEFAASLISQLNERGSLSEKQIAAGYKSLAKVEERRKERDAAQAAQSGAVDVRPIEKLFETAASNGLKKPKFYAGGVVLSLAPPHGKNPGAIYVKDGGQYSGKIVGGQFKAYGNVRPGLLDNIAEIARDPLKTAVKHGHKTGSCSCCNRTLTHPLSIELGIGPICRGKWGL